ncbi:MAG: FAD-dependent oxidoreductase [Planctomycetaceae bacterium]|nr:FAD-dependent oxidoreductase [Planctomycetaceae bacterium]
MHKILLPILFICLATFLLAADKPAVWLEAEGFQELGGWVIDQQSFNQMGSAYIMAHGMGVPVADATTECEIPEKGFWNVWVRTRDWTAPWKRGTPAGRFQLIIGGKTLPTALGNNGAEWAWQRAGTIELEKGTTAAALHDLTGFNGRCDAIYLTTDADAVPTNEPKELDTFRRSMMERMGKKRIDDPVVYDLAIAGGGIAGTCAALAAIQTGAKVVLIQDRPVLGGCNSSEVRVTLGGNTLIPPYPNIGKAVELISPIALGFDGTEKPRPASFFEDDRKEQAFYRTRGHRKLALNERVFAVEKDPNDPQRIAAFIARNSRTGIETRYRAKNFADCTGDATIARLMGAETMYGREERSRFNETLAPEKADNFVMGMSTLWGSQKSPTPTTFPDVDWGIEFTEDKVYPVRSGHWEWETGYFRDMADEAEYIRDYGIMTVFANWSFLKNHSKHKDDWANDTLEWITPVGGKRESYRVVGDHIVTQNDIEKNVIYPDATATSTWNLDNHFPDPAHAEKFEEPFRSCAYHRCYEKPFPVPYRSLYARDVKNLFLGGRVISVSHVAFSATRVMRTLGCLGEVIGMASSVCANENIDPRDVYPAHFDKLKALMEQGVRFSTYHSGGTGSSESYHFKDIGWFPVNDTLRAARNLTPEREAEYQRRIKPLGVVHKSMERSPTPVWLENAGKNLALDAKISVSSTQTDGGYDAKYINDGKYDFEVLEGRWLSKPGPVSWVEFSFAEPVSVNAVRIISGAYGTECPLIGFVLQRKDGEQWADIPETRTEKNPNTDFSTRFNTVTGSTFRLYITETLHGVARIKEVELYKIP